MGINASELRDFLNQKVKQYNNPRVVVSDPIQVPKQFTHKQDIEIAAFFAATIAWGNRASIIKNAQNLMERMDNTPYDFVMQASRDDLKALNGFVHRTFNEVDVLFFIQALKNIYSETKVWRRCFCQKTMKNTFTMQSAALEKRFLISPTPNAHPNMFLTHKKVLPPKGCICFCVG